ERVACNTGERAVVDEIAGRSQVEVVNRSRFEIVALRSKNKRISEIGSPLTGQLLLSSLVAMGVIHLRLVWSSAESGRGCINAIDCESKIQWNSNGLNRGFGSETFRK